ncbi:MAG: hypothetical protein EVB11_11000 [Winogradskyella sp.]|nr:MAG: hypothetical protein EVB11_11000 [Winogradskyella sp.]
MENDFLNKLWNAQDDNSGINSPKDIIAKAKTQRRRQLGAILIMSITVLVLLAFIIYVSPNKWNNFTLGLILMISSLTFRIILEFGSIYQRESRLVSMDSKSYTSYLKSYYKARVIINYVVTPICIAVYIYGFYLLLPYFKTQFSEGFYLYILISGIVSLIAIIAIITYSIRRESRFLQQLKKQ